MATDDTTHGVKVYLPPRDSIEPAFERNNVALFFGLDDGFFIPAMAVIASIVRHGSPRNNYDIFILQTDVSRERMERARSWLEDIPNVSLRFVDMSVVMAMSGVDHFHTTRYFNLTVYFRLFAPRIFRQYDKVLHLDADILVFADIAELFAVDMSGAAILACHDFATEHQSVVDPAAGAYWRDELGKEPGEGYFNAGIMVMNLEAMRRGTNTAAFLKKIGELTSPALPDQDVLNSVAKGRVKFIGCEWNFMDWMFDADERSLFFGYVSEEARAEIRAKRDMIKILHYTERKPWAPEYMGTHEELFWEQLAQTPFYQDMFAVLSAQLSPIRFCLRYARLTLASWNFLLLGRVLRRGRWEKYRARLVNLGLRKRGLLRQWRRVRAGKTGSEKPRAESFKQG